MSELADAFPRRRSPRPPTAAEVERARRECARHFPSIFAPPLGDLRLCVAEACGEAWPCRAYRANEAVLRAAWPFGAPPDYGGELPPAAYR